MDTSKDSGTVPGGTGSESKQWWEIGLENAGGYLTGIGTIINAINKTTPTTNVYQSGGTPPGGATPTMMGGIWLYIIIALIAIVALFIIFKK